MDHYPSCWLGSFFHTVPSHGCIAPTQMRENVTLRLNTRCAFYNLSNTQLLNQLKNFIFFPQLMWKRDIVLDLGQCINFTFISQWMFPGGRLCTFQTPSELPAQCYRGGLWGERGRASDTRQVDCSLPISCSQLFHLSGKPSVKCDPQPLGVIGYEYPVKPVWWKDVNILLMFRLLIHTPDPSYHGQWQVSKRMTLFLWEPLTHRGWAGG